MSENYAATEAQILADMAERKARRQRAGHAHMAAMNEALERHDAAHSTPVPGCELCVGRELSSQVHIHRAGSDNGRPTFRLIVKAGDGHEVARSEDFDFSAMNLAEGQIEQDFGIDLASVPVAGNHCPDCRKSGIQFRAKDEPPAVVPAPEPEPEPILPAPADETTPEDAHGLDRRYFAGLHSLLDRASFPVDVDAVSYVDSRDVPESPWQGGRGYCDYDRAVTAAIGSPDDRGWNGRRAWASIVVAIHCSESGRLEIGGLYQSSHGTLYVWSEREQTWTMFDLRPRDVERLAQRVILKLAWRQLDPLAAR